MNVCLRLKWIIFQMRYFQLTPNFFFFILFTFAWIAFTILTKSVNWTSSPTTNRLQWCRLHFGDGIGISNFDDRPTRFSPNFNWNVRHLWFLATGVIANNRQFEFVVILTICKMHTISRTKSSWWIIFRSSIRVWRFKVEKLALLFF